MIFFFLHVIQHSYLKGTKDGGIDSLALFLVSGFSKTTVSCHLFVKCKIEVQYGIDCENLKRIKAHK